MQHVDREQGQLDLTYDAKGLQDLQHTAHVTHCTVHIDRRGHAGTVESKDV